MAAIKDTAVEMIQLVFPEHGNDRGMLYGGRMMQWIATAATLSAMRVARGQVTLASMDDLDFHNPVRVGDLLTFRAQVEAVGHSSMEMGVEVIGERPGVQERYLATSSHLVMVALDARERPRAVGVEIMPDGPEEAAVHRAAVARAQARAARLRDRGRRALDVTADPDTPYSVEVTRFVFPEDAFSGSQMFAGKLMMALDEVAAIVALRYARGTAVTGSIDAMSFYAPVHVGQLVIYRAALNYVGRASMEVGVKVLAEEPATGEQRHTCTAFLTFVHVDNAGRPVPLPPYTPATPHEKKRWAEAESRRISRLARLRASEPR